MKLYFVVPFAVETYVPVTKENIADFGNVIFFIEGHPFVSELKKLLVAHPSRGSFLFKNTRLVADFGTSEGTYLVDRAGLIIKEGTSVVYKLSSTEIERLERQLQYFLGVVDVNASKRLAP